MNLDLTGAVAQVICSLCSKEQDVSCLPKRTPTTVFSGARIFWLYYCCSANCMETAHSHRQVQQNCSSCGACMGKYFCKVCKFFDDDVSVLESQTMNKETEFNVLFAAFLFFLLLHIHTVLLWVQVSKGQYHCDGCGICR